MNKLQYLYRSIGFACIIAAVMFAKEPDGMKNTKSQFQKSSGQPSATLLNINRMSSWYESNGKQEQNPFTGNSGMTYPRGTSTVLYSSGLMWGGYSNDAAMASNQPRVSGQSYNVGTAPGAILGYRTGVTENPADADVRIWRIRKDYSVADLKQDAAEINSVALSNVSDAQVTAVRTQYATDWKEWPWKKGAPFYDTGYLDENLNLVGANNKVLDRGEDTNENGVLDAGEDLNKNGVLDAEAPGAADADQVIWYVANDIRAGDSPWKTKPLGLEMQVTIWGYNRTDALGNMLFKKFKLIYKGTATTPANGLISDMYLCQWSDPDLGDAGDDFAGCDVALSLGYVYNSTTQDKQYQAFDIAPPASGFDFLQGPIVQSPADTAVFDLKYRPGYKNLPMTSFIYFAAGGNYSDPPFTLNGSWQWYSMFLGGPPTPQPPPFPGKLIDPKANDSTTFWLSGNPEDNSNPNTNTRWIDGFWEPSGDRRILLTSGPFNMALGDTQELVSAVIAGLGSDYIASIKVLKFYDKTTQAAYNNLFNLPKPPPAPKFSFVELDKGIILEWEKDSAGVLDTEGSNSKGFVFEGYNVYQLPSVTSPLSNAKKLATYDLATDPSTISQDDFDEASGQVLTKPVQLGKNSGLTRYMYITKDEIRNKPLVNGQQYYFAVTAYNYNADPLLVTKSFESTPSVAVITPHQPNPGVVIPYAVNDVLTPTLEQTPGNSNDAVVGIQIFNPTLQRGDTYEVWWGGVAASRNYTIVKTISGSTDHALVKAHMSSTTLPNAKGVGLFTLNDAKTSVSYTVTTTKLTGAITAAHIHLGAAGATGNPVHTLTFKGHISGTDTAKGTWAIPDSLKDEFYAGNLYVNIHTAANPSGEIRGQISEGLFARTNLASAVAVPPAITTFTEHRLPAEGLSFYVAPATKGIKSVQQMAPGSPVNVVGAANPSKRYSIVGPLSNFVGTKGNETDIEIRFVAGTNYALSMPTSNSTPALAKYIKVPFAAYKDTVRVWPVVLQAATDTTWSIDDANPIVNGKKTFDMILAIIDDRSPTNANISYYSPANAVFPPTGGNKTSLVVASSRIVENVRFVSESNDGAIPENGTIVRFTPAKSVQIGQVNAFSIGSYKTGVVAAAKVEVSKVNVFPNPYYAVNSSERRREARYVTFSHLPEKATIRIFNLAGTLVTTLEKNSTQQFFEWDLTNHKGLPVASGIYLVHIDMGDLGVKILKSAIIMEQQFLDNF